MPRVDALLRFGGPVYIEPSSDSARPRLTFQAHQGDSLCRDPKLPCDRLDGLLSGQPPGLVVHNDLNIGPIKHLGLGFSLRLQTGHPIWAGILTCSGVHLISSIPISSRIARFLALAFESAFTATIPWPGCP